MGRTNKVVAGDYAGKTLYPGFFSPSIITGELKNEAVPLNRHTIACYEVHDGRRVGRKAVTNLINTTFPRQAKDAPDGGILIAVEFKDGKRSLLEVDEKYYINVMSAII